MKIIVLRRISKEKHVFIIVKNIYIYVNLKKFILLHQL